MKELTNMTHKSVFFMFVFNCCGAFFLYLKVPKKKKTLSKSRRLKSYLKLSMLVYLLTISVYFILANVPEVKPNGAF